MFDFRLKRAQVALADGRLDEAFELLKDPSLRQHRAGQKLLTKLSKAFIRRGQAHLKAQRLAPALADCLHAEKLAGNIPDVVKLRSMICEQIETERAQSHEQAEQLAKAKEQMQNGWLSTGRKILSQTDDLQARCLLKNAEMLEVENESAIKRIEQALKTGQTTLAGQIYQTSTLGKCLDQKAVSILNRIRQQAYQTLHGYLVEGQIHLAASFLNELTCPVSSCETIGPLRQAIEYSRQAIGRIDAGNFEAAVICLRKMQTLLPKAKWIGQVIRQGRSAAAAQAELQASPLGILEGLAMSKIDEAPIPTEKNAQQSPAINDVPFIQRYNGMDMKKRFILQMDGIGAYHVLCEDRVTIGPVSSSTRSDIELVTAPDVRCKQIERVEGDYFFGQADSGSGRQLLGDGDRVELSPRCRFKFTLPNPASSTACLIPSSARFPRVDISGVILMGREILLGPERNNHVQSGQILEAITLFLQDGQIRCRSNQPVVVDGRALAGGQALPMDKQIETGDFRFSLMTYGTSE